MLVVVSDALFPLFVVVDVGEKGLLEELFVFLEADEAVFVLVYVLGVLFVVEGYFFSMFVDLVGVDFSVDVSRLGILLVVGAVEAEGGGEEEKGQQEENRFGLHLTRITLLLSEYLWERRRKV